MTPEAFIDRLFSLRKIFLVSFDPRKNKHCDVFSLYVQNQAFQIELTLQKSIMICNHLSVVLITLEACDNVIRHLEGIR